MFQLSLTTYGQSLVSSSIQIDGIALTASYTSTISSLENVSSLTTVFDDDSVGNYNGSTLNIRIRDLSSAAYQAKTIVFYKLVNSVKKIVAAYSNNSAIVNKTASSEVNLFLSFDASCFTHGFTLSSIQASPSSASLNNDGIVHIEDESTSADDSYSVYSKPQVDAKLSNQISSAQYNSTTGKIEFYNSNNTKLNTDIDATPFTKDGMIDSVSIVTVGQTIPPLYGDTEGVVLVSYLSGYSISTMKAVRDGLGIEIGAAKRLVEQDLPAFIYTGDSSQDVYNAILASSSYNSSKMTFYLNVATIEQVKCLRFHFNSDANKSDIDIPLEDLSQVLEDKLKTVAFTGSYNDLTNKPNIPSVDYACNKASNVIAGTGNIYGNQLVFRVGDNLYESICTSYTVDTTKTKNPHGFYLDRILYYNYSLTKNSGETALSTYIYTSYPSFNGRYSFNCLNNSLTNNQAIYLVVTFNSTDRKFYLDDTWWTQTLPSTEDNKFYVYLGIVTDTSYSSIFLETDHPIFFYKNGKIRQTSAEIIDTVADMYVPTSRTVNSKALSSNITLTLDDVSDGTNRAIPTNTNQLTNGAGFITSSSSITGNAATSTKSKKLYFTSDGSGDVDLIEANSTVKIIPSGTTKTKYLGDSDHQFKNIYSETFTGDLSGNATTATTSTNLASAPSLSWTDASSSSAGATLKVTAGGQESTVATISTVRKAYQPYISTSSTSSSYPLVFTSNVTAGFKALYTDTVNSCYYNPSTNTLACTNFSGTLSGNATGLSAVYSNSTKTLSLTNGNWVSNTRIEATSLSSYTLYVGGTTILHDSDDDTFSIMNNDGPIYFTDINGDNQLVIGTGSSFANKLTFSSDMSDHSNSEVSSISLVTLVNDEDQEYTVTKWESSDSIRIESSSSVALVGDSSSLRVSDQIYINNNIIPISTVNIGDDIGNPINNIYTQYLDLCYTDSDDSPSNYYLYANSNGTYLSSSFLPDSSSSLNLGSTSKKWYNTYSDIVRTDSIRPIDNDTPNPANLSGYTKILYGALEGKDSSNNEFYFFPVNNRSTPAFGCGGNILPSTTSTGLSNGLYLGSSNAKWNTVYSRYLGRYESANAESRIAAFYGNSLYAQNFNIPFGTCSTGSSTQIKEVNLTNNSGMPVSELFTGMIILVRFNETNTKSDPALRITGVGTGYKFIKRVGTTAAGTDEASSWMANETVMLRYDGTNWVIVNHNTTAMSSIDSSITNIIPSANNSYNIGSNAYYWKEIHAVKLYLYSGTNRSYMNYYSSGIDVYGNLTPGNSGYNLGSVSYPWKNIYGVLTSLYGTGIGSIHLALAIFKNTSSTYNYFVRKGTTISLNTSLNAQTTLGGDTQTATLVSVTGLYAARFALSSDYTGFTSNTSNDLRIVPVQSDASTTTAITSTTPLAIDGSTFALLNEVFVPKNKSNGVIIPVLLLRLT